MNDLTPMPESEARAARKEQGVGMLAESSKQDGSDCLLKVEHLWKSYSAVVLADVAFDARAGEVHALIGENGAGKSTLVRIIAGLTQADRGEMHLHGQPFAPRDKVQAEALGVRIVLQELNLIGNLSVAENIFLDHLPHRLGWIDFE